MRIRSKLLVKLGAWIFAKAVQVLYRTLRLERRCPPGTCPYERPQGPERYFYSTWHDSMLTPAFGGSQAYTVALTSQHTDGSFVAGVLQAIGMRTVRGSTGRGGARAIRELIHLNLHTVITPDGPRGPRRQVSPGILFLASKTGRGIVPVAASADRYWRIPGSWTDLEIPKPFARVYLLAGDPIYVPADADRDTLETYRQQVQQAMDALSAESARLAGHTEADRRPKIRGVHSRRCRVDRSQPACPKYLKREPSAQAQPER